jgi:hypothetical protein
MERVTYAIQSVRPQLARNAEHDLAHAHDDTPMDDELSEFGTALVTVSAMPDEKFRQISELHDGEVRGQGRLLPFLANNADSNICGLDHAHVVAAITNATNALSRMALD